MLQDTIASSFAVDPVRVGSLALIAAGAIGAHLLIRLVKGVGDRLIGPERRHPRIATVLSLLVSAATFTTWFVAVGLFLGELGVDLTAYFATATVVGLAVGFGSQGLVQDVVIGLTLIFSDAMDIGDMVEVSGHIGRVQRIGLRFTTLTNFLGQTVFIPNRNIAVVGRYRGGVVRAYMDVQVPEGADPDDVAATVLRLARSFRGQHAAAVVGEPEVFERSGERDDPDAPPPWQFVRLKLRLWPGQQTLVETVFRQRVVAHMKTLDETYADWMAPVTYRVS